MICLLALVVQVSHRQAARHARGHTDASATDADAAHSDDAARLCPRGHQMEVRNLAASARHAFVLESAAG